MHYCDGKSRLHFSCLAFSRNPLADICWAIPERDVVRFAAFEKTDRVLIHQRQVFQIHDYAATARFCAQQCFQLAYVFSAHSTAQLKDHLSIRGPRDPQHGNSCFFEIGHMHRLAIKAPNVIH